MKFKLNFLAVAMTFSACSHVMADDIVSVVNRALLQDPDVLEVANNHMSRQGEVQQAEAGYLPKVDMNAGYGWEMTDSPGTRGRETDFPQDNGHHDEDLYRGEFGLTITQMLWDGRATESEVDRQTSRVDSAKNRLSGVAEDVALSAVKAYVDVQRYREILALSEENVEKHKAIREQISKKVESGFSTQADLDQIDARLSLVEANLVAARANMLDAVSTYKRRVGEEPAEQLDPAIEVRDVIPGSADEAIELSLNTNPVVAQAASDIEAAQAQHNASYQNHHPYVYLELSGDLNNNLDGTAGHYNESAAMIKMNYNLYNGGRDVGRIVQTAYQVQEAKEIRNRSLRQLEEEIRLAWAALESTDRQLEFLIKQVGFTESTRQAYAEQYTVSKRSLLDLLNTENEVYDAKVSLTNANADNIYAQYRIVSAMGNLIDKLGVNMADLQKLALNKDNLGSSRAITIMKPDFLVITEEDEAPTQGDERAN